MRLSEEALWQAINYTNTAQQDLDNNLSYIRNSTTPLLAEWKDAHVERFLEELDLFDSYVKETTRNMEDIKVFLKGYINFIQEYNYSY